MRFGKEFYEDEADAVAPAAVAAPPDDACHPWTKKIAKMNRAIDAIRASKASPASPPPPKARAKPRPRAARPSRAKARSPSSTLEPSCPLVASPAAGSTAAGSPAASSALGSPARPESTLDPAEHFEYDAPDDDCEAAFLDIEPSPRARGDDYVDFGGKPIAPARTVRVLEVCGVRPFAGRELSPSP